MKAAKTITELATEIERQQNAKEDFITPTTSLTLETSELKDPEHNGGITSYLRIKDANVDADSGFTSDGEFGVLPLAHEQIGLRLGIPKGFYERLRVGVPAKNSRGARPANTTLLDHTVNTLFRSEPQNRLVRTIDGRARAFLSNRYRMLDNFDLCEAILPEISEMDSPIIEGEITDLKLYLKVLLPKIQAEVPEVGDIVQAGFIVQNSEVGFGTLSVQPLIYTLRCKNGMIAPDFGVRRYHVGRAAETMEDAYQVFRDETLRQDDKAFWMKVVDVVRAAADEAKFMDIVARLGETATTPPMDDVQVGVERVAKKVNLTEGESKGVLHHLATGGNLSLYGLHSAITRMAQDVPSYDRSVELETVAGQLVTMPKAEWASIAAPAAA